MFGKGRSLSALFSHRDALFYKEGAAAFFILFYFFMENLNGIWANWDSVHGLRLLDVGDGSLEC